VFTNFVIEELKYLTFLSPSLEHLRNFHFIYFLDYLMTKLTICQGIKAIGRIHNHDYEKAKAPSFDI